MSPTTGDHFGAAFTAPGDIFKDYFGEKTEEVNEYIQRYNVNLRPKKVKEEDANVIVLASGNLGMVYLTDHIDRLTYEQMNTIYPDLLPGLVKHEGIGFILVNSDIHGPLVIGNIGTYYLNDDRIEGENPLADFGKNAVEHIRRTNGFKYTPDILAISLFDPENNEVAAFEELVGSHGGIGGEQSFPFILHPAEWDLGEELIGAEKVYMAFKSEIEKIGL
jgi:hypothetical protein